MSDLAKAGTKEEAIRQMSVVDKSLADTITRRLEIEERKKEINAKWHASKEYDELRELSKEDRELTIIQHEKNGARKMIYHLLKKFGVEIPKTKLTRMAERDENVRALVEV